MKKTKSVRIKLIILSLIVLLTLTGCGKNVKKANNSTDKNKTMETSKPSTAKSINLASNSSFEEGNITLGRPNAWTTKGQILDESSGWVKEEAHSGKHSLKIENIGGTDAYWKGNPIIFKKPTNAFKASIWTMAKDIKDETGKGKFQLAFDVFLLGNQNKETTKRVSININKIDSKWDNTEKKIFFTENIIKIVPYLSFSEMTGTVWFDDLSLNSIQIDWTKGKTLFDSSKDGSFSGQIEKGIDNSFILKGNKSLYSSVNAYIPVNANKIYKLSGEFKSLNPIKSIISFGYIPYTGDKKFISSSSANYVSETETELIKPCISTDKVIVVKDASNWKITWNGCVAFDIDDSGQYKDIPNFKFSSFGIENIKKSGQWWNVYLKKEIGSDYPANTKIREHMAGSAQIFNVEDQFSLSDNWTKLQSINGRGTYTPLEFGHNTLSGLFLGTKYIKIVISVNCGNIDNAEIGFKNIKLIELDEI
jgi:hypothetical protein